MKNIISILMITTLSLSACAPQPESTKGFVLPNGGIDRGLQAYEDLQCAACHKVLNLDIAYTGADQAVILGGDTTRVKTYGDLLTSIVNPSHKLAPGFVRTAAAPGEESPMAAANLNAVMTVQQLIDLVSFLQPQYKVVAPPHDPYVYYYVR